MLSETEEPAFLPFPGARVGNLELKQARSQGATAGFRKASDFSLIFESKEGTLVKRTELANGKVAGQLRDLGRPMELRKMLKIKITVQVEKDGDSFYAYCPGLKGLHVDGSTEEEAIDNAVEAASLYVSSMIQHNDPLPIGADFSAEEEALRPSSEIRTLSRNVEMPWPSAQACGVS
jgi:predicted RNase H-like HicB family nuclease